VKEERLVDIRTFEKTAFELGRNLVGMALIWARTFLLLCF